MMKKQAISEMTKEWMLVRHLSIVYTCRVRDCLGKAILQKHRKNNKTQTKIFARRHNFSPLSDIHIPLKN